MKKLALFKKKNLIAVIGLGRMGRAYLARLQNAGLLVRAAELGDWERAVGENSEAIMIFALHSGIDTRRLILALDPSRVSYLLDLTTQSLTDSRFCAGVAKECGIEYFGGGVTGGAEQARIGNLSLLVGPPLPAVVADVATTLGTVIEFKDAMTASGAKLLHNLVLILQNHALAIALRLGDRLGIDNLEAVLDSGTAGRLPSQTSAVRDHRVSPCSSYTGKLAAKDLRALLISFPELAHTICLDFVSLIQLYDLYPENPYTVAALEGALRKSYEPS